ncbi:MAG: hypothetical protein AAF664_25395, partial [Planctomycetota bacterium]
MKSMISRGALTPGYGSLPDAIALRLIKSTGHSEFRFYATSLNFETKTHGECRYEQTERPKARLAS